jgi:hypothetical protein
MLQKTFNHEEKKSLVRLRHKWEDNMKLDLKEIGCESVD